MSSLYRVEDGDSCELSQDEPLTPDELAKQEAFKDMAAFGWLD